jgi:hypothetical protein
MNTYLRLLFNIKLLLLAAGVAALIAAFETKEISFFFLSSAFLMLEYRTYCQLSQRLSSSYKLERKIFKDLSTLKRLIDFELYIISDLNLEGINIDILAVSRKFLLLIEVKPRFKPAARKQLSYSSFKLKRLLRKNHFPFLPFFSYLAVPSSTLKQELYSFLKQKEKEKDLIEKNVLLSFTCRLFQSMV